MTTGRWQRIEGALVFAGGIAVVWVQSGFAPLWPGWALMLLFLAPDLGMLCYLAGPKIGAAGYNALHLYGAGALLIAVGGALGVPMLTAGGALWMAHVGVDRLLGYGLKEVTGFKVTHLGPIGGASGRDRSE